MDNYVIKSAALRGYDEVVSELGGDRDSLYLAAGIDKSRIEDPEQFIPYETYLKLLNIAAENLNCDTFGLRLAQKKDGSQFGILCLIIETSPSMLEALRTFGRFLHFQSQSATLSLSTEGEFTYWKHTIHYQGDESLGQAYQNAMGVGSNIIDLISDNSLTPVCAYSIFDREKVASYAKSRVSCPITFNAEFNGWKFKTQDLHQLPPQSDPALNQLLKNQLDTLLDELEQNFELKIKEVIRRALAIGDPSIDRVANYLNKNRRSFQRQLESHNLLYKDVLDDVRLEIAKHHLRYSNLPLTHIADMLCYNNLSSFSRFFTKRLGLTPSKWRTINVQQ